MALSIVSDTTQTVLPAPAQTFATHIICAFLGYGLFLTASGASVLYLAQNRLLKRKTFGIVFQDLPSLEKLERLEIVCSRLGLLIFTIALYAGASIATMLKVPFWFELKFLAAQVTWLVFFVLVAGRAMRWINGRTAAKCVLAGASLVLITFALGHPLSKQTTTTQFQVPSFRFQVDRSIANLKLETRNQKLPLEVRA